MNKIGILKTIFIATALMLIPTSMFAARVYIEANTANVSAGDIVILSVKLDSQKATINSIDGSIGITGNENAIVNDFSLAKSLFTLWPQTPSLSADGSTISFVGGVPGGFSKDGATVFNIILETQKEGAITIAPKDIILFANDGKGSRAPVTVDAFTLQINPKEVNTKNTNEWINLVTSDKTAPNSFTVALGRDSSILDGKRFAFFNATDDQSGISYYEVSEGGAPTVRSGSMYVLQNQDGNDDPALIVTAYDKAGNKRIAEYEKTSTTIFGVSLRFIIVLIVIVMAWIFYRKIRKSKKNTPKNDYVQPKKFQ